MNAKTIWIFPTLLFVFLLLVAVDQHAEAAVFKEDNKIFLMDRTGERWDITQAVSMGFNPDRFEFGIGRDAFYPLDETHWKAGSKQGDSKMRIIGIAGDGHAHAYSVNTLRHHETANTFLDSDAIVAAY
jgi:hypothetical protein